MRQHTAAEVGTKLLLDESGCGLARFPSAKRELVDDETRRALQSLGYLE
jgi:hypothetical protein